MRALRPIYLLSTVTLLLLAGFWIHSFTGVGHVGYCFLPRDGELGPECEWVIAAEAGSITLVQIPYMRYLDFGFNYGFSRFGEGSVVGEGGGTVLRSIGRFRLHHGSEGEEFYGLPCRWILSVPFWLPMMILAVTALFARRLYTQSKSDAQQVVAPNGP